MVVVVVVVVVVIVAATAAAKVNGWVPSSLGTVGMDNAAIWVGSRPGDISTRAGPAPAFVWLAYSEEREKKGKKGTYATLRYHSVRFLPKKKKQEKKGSIRGGGSKRQRYPAIVQIPPALGVATDTTLYSSFPQHPASISCSKTGHLSTPDQSFFRLAWHSYISFIGPRKARRQYTCTKRAQVHGTAWDSIKRPLLGSVLRAGMLSSLRREARTRIFAIDSPHCRVLWCHVDAINGQWPLCCRQSSK